LVIIAGDLITRAPRYIEPAARQAGRLRARHGVLACVGDHDNFAYMDRRRSLREVTEALARHGVAMLDNEVRRVRVGGAEIAVVLATNNYVNRIDRDTTAALMAAAGGADLQIVAAHQTSPELLAGAREGGADLFLGGHTHGGQVRFWLPFLDLTPVRFETAYIDGAYQLGDMMLTVTSGLGMSVTPMRYRAPATIEIIRLRRAAR
ncbi:MAG TPA: metallophosphoesterase, partial [Kofleriaceae bacterium]|nr:metallophosphoesterase [Kofleriaceae bacterium]